MSHNHSKIRELLSIHNVDAVVLTFLPYIRWACGFTGSSALLIVDRDHVHFLSDERYRVQSHREVEDAVIHIGAVTPIDLAVSEGLFGSYNRVAVQAEHVSMAEHAKLVRTIPSITWVPVQGMLQAEVASKSPHEIDAIRGAQAITDDVFSYLLGFIKSGHREQEIAAEIVYQHLMRGAASMSFDPIVASGANGSLPHVRPSEKAIEPGELVVLDFGCFYDGYASDMTRTVAIGKPTDEAKRVYSTVSEAQERAIDAASAGQTTRELDQLARGVIVDAGYGDFFSHSLGHGDRVLWLFITKEAPNYSSRL